MLSSFYFAFTISQNNAVPSSPHPTRAGHEGLVLGGWFSMLSLVTFGRIGMVATELNRHPSIVGGLPSLAAFFWIVGALFLGAAALLHRRKEKLRAGLL